MNGMIKTLTATGLAAVLAGVVPTTFAGQNDQASEKIKEAENTLQESKNQIQQMKADENVSRLLKYAKGVFLVPDYGRAALGVGGAGGEGVLLVNNGDQWSDPLFYNFGAFNAGLEAGIEAGQVAMILMTQEAVDSFMQDNNWSLNADSGFTFVDYSTRAQASGGKGDIVMWSDTEGGFANLSINVEDIVPDEEENNAYYGKDIRLEEVARGKTETQRDNPLENALPTS